MASHDRTAFNRLLMDLNEVVAQLAKQYQGDVEAVFLENELLRSQVHDKGKASSSVGGQREAKACVFEETTLHRGTGVCTERGCTILRPSEIDAELEAEANSHVLNEDFSTANDTGDDGVDDDLKDSVASTPIPDATFISHPTNMKDLLKQTLHEGQLSSISFVMRVPWIDQREFEEVKLVQMLEAENSQRSKVKHDHDQQLVNSFKELPLPDRTFWYILHPESRIRGYWMLLCMIFIMYDLVTVPINVCFDLEYTSLFEAVDFTTSVFWTMDIFLTFFTGVRNSFHHMEMHPRRIACIYLKTWFFFDVGLVVPEWVAMTVGSKEGGRVSVFRMLRWGRLMRLLRMARILRLSRLRPLLRHLVYIFNLSKAYVQLIQALIALTFLLFVFIHITSCFWYALGNNLDNGWVEHNGLESATVAHSYAVSMHWTFSRLHGIQSYNKMERPLEIVLDAMMIYFSLLVIAYYNGILAAIALTGANSQSFNLWKMSILYIRRHKVSPSLDVKMNRFLEARKVDGAKESQEEETALLHELPRNLRNDLLFEARARYLTTMRFFEDEISNSPRAVRQICIEALTSAVFVHGTVVWATGDACDSMLFVTSGKLWYMLNASAEELEEEMNRRASDLLLAVIKHTVESHDGRPLTEGSTISEPVLWTQWAHFGTLVSADESTALALQPQSLAQVIMEFKAPLCHAVKYAKHFCWRMNHCEQIDDLTQFPELNITELDSDLYQGGDFDHFMFLSHYKVEAGTEATLIRDALQEILKAEPAHPANLLRSAIFVDSEDLTDLAGLKDHVNGSVALVLLLTPAVLSRPWCLLEIVTAVRSGVNIVPVEIFRPGSKYNYPDDAFYDNIRKARGLPQGAVQLLEGEGITLYDVEQAIRQVFLKVALPFSPHKAKGVREAELQCILKRCEAS